MADKKLPGDDDLVKARRRVGFGAVNMPTENLTKKGEAIGEGHLVMMRFREAVEREDFEPIGFESVTAADLSAAAEG